MNIQAYIESGILEAYALDALTPEERREVAAHIARHPELAAELKAIEEGLLAMARSGEEAPPPHLKEYIWDTLSAAPEPAAVVAAPADNAPKTLPLPPPSRPSWQRAAIWAAVMVSVLTNFILLSQKNKLTDEQQALRRQVDSVMQHTGQLMAGMVRERELLADSSMQAVVMKSMKPGHPMAATVYWSPHNGDTYLSIQKLPVPPAGKQYQLWVIQEGKPASMGVIDNGMVASGTVRKLDISVASSQAFAISLERLGGSEVPTMEEIQVMGKPI